MMTMFEPPLTSRASTTFPPASLLLSYWMVGCYFMAIKRYSECRQIGDRTTVAAYRKSLAWFTPEKLLVAIMFYGAAAMLFSSGIGRRTFGCLE